MKAYKAKIKDVLGFDDTVLLLVGIPIVSFLVPLLFLRATLAEGFTPYLPKWGISLMYTVTYWFSIRYLFIFMRRRFPEHGQVRKRVIYTIATAIVAYFILNFFLHFFHKHDYTEVRDFDYNVASLTILALVSAIYESIFLYDRWRRSIVEAEQLRRENMQSQLEGLKNQVNPHFLFNSLNTLAYIIPEDPPKAVKFVEKLSKVYRYILEIRDRQLIPLDEELDFLKSYVFLVQERFGDSFHMRLDIPGHLHKRQIVPLSLQILIENAIKHNVISSQMPLTVEIFVENDHWLIVRNNLQKKKQKMPSTQVGLQNIKHRYSFFTNDEVVVEAGPELFTVRIPLISEQ